MNKSAIRLVASTFTGVILLSMATLTYPQAQADESTQVEGGDCAFGDGQPLQPTTITHFADGGTVYRFADAGGEGETILPDPPEGFRPETASDELLSRYGFPPRPADPDDLTWWEADMRSYADTPLPVKCESAYDAAASTADYLDWYTPSDPLLRGGVETWDSANWAGVAANHPAGDQFVSVSGEYDQPPSNSDGCNTSEEVSWVGLGGVYSQGLLQAGTGIKPNGDKYAWYEYLKAGGGVPIQPIDNLNVHVGDHMHISVFYEPANDKAGFYVLNETTGDSKSVIKNNLGAAYYDGKTAEAVDERPAYGPGNYANLKNFGHVDWVHAKLEKEDGSWVQLGDTNDPKRIVMWKGGDTRLAHPENFSGGSFKENWDHC